VRTNALLAVLALAGTVFAMMQSLVIPALPRIQASLGTSADGAAWISTAYLLSASVLTPVIGRLGETSGKRRMMLASLAAFAAGTLVCAVAGNLGELVAGAPAASGYIGALILCAGATCVGAVVACAAPRKALR
jgi:MFS family permease